MPNTPFQVVSLPSLQFTTNTLTVPSGTYNLNDTNKTYDLAGKYTVSSSSYYDNKTDAYNAFNGTASSYWKTNTIENNFDFSPTVTPYTKSPYLISDIPNAPSIYQGGGTLGSNFFSTKLQKSIGDITKFDGEWLQIELPVLINLTSYSLLTPKPQNNMNYFPLEFTVLGSQSGKDGEWWIVDQESFGTFFKSGTGCCSSQTIPDMANQQSTVFNLTNTNTNAYKFFRLVITKMPYGTSTVRISQWNLIGNKSTVVVGNTTVTGNTTIQGFTLMDKEVTYYDLNPPTNKVTQFSISKPLYRSIITENKPFLGTDTGNNLEYGVFVALVIALIGTSMYIMHQSK